MPTPIVELSPTPGLFLAATWQNDTLHYFIVQGNNQEDAKEILDEYFSAKYEPGQWTLETIKEAQVLKRGN